MKPLGKLIVEVIGGVTPLERNVDVASLLLVPPQLMEVRLPASDWLHRRAQSNCMKQEGLLAASLHFAQHINDRRMALVPHVRLLKSTHPGREHQVSSEMLHQSTKQVV